MKKKEKFVSQLEKESIKKLLKKIRKEWRLIAGKKLEREFLFKDFAGALVFVNRVGKAAEEQYHHPEILFGFGKAKIWLWTHKIKGLSRADFILAKKIDKIFTRSNKRKKH